MLSELIEEAKNEFVADFKDKENVDELAKIYKEGMIKAFTIMFEQSLHQRTSFDLVQE